MAGRALSRQLPTVHAFTRLAFLAPLALWPSAPQVEPPGIPRLHGRVLLADGGSAVGLRAVIRAGASADSAAIAADGSFTLSLADVRCDSIDIEIDTASGVPRRYYAARARVGVRARPSAAPIHPPSTGPAPLPWDVAVPTHDSIRIVLVPTEFTIAAGAYAGTRVPIGIDVAVGGVRRGPRFWRVSGAPRGHGSPVSWPDSSFPLPVVFESAARAPLTVDTAAFWAIARRLEGDFGRPLFRPASAPAADDDGRHVGVRFDAAAHAAGMTFITYDNWGTIAHASVELRTVAQLRDPRVITHELIHALGVGHARWWPSVMGAPDDLTARATAADVAHTELLYALRRAHVADRATHGVAEAVGPLAVGVRSPPIGCGAAERAAIPSP